jgi:hypothetical protein
MDRSTGWCRRTPHTQLELSSHRGSPRAARLGPAVCGPAAAAQAALQTQHSAWKSDPLRFFLCVGGLGARSGAEHCPRAREGSADGGAWRHDAARAETSHCNSVSRNSDRGRSDSRCQTTAGNVDRDVHEEREPRAMAPWPPGTEPWTTTARLCEATSVLLGLGSVLADRGTTRKPRRPPGFSFLSPSPDRQSISHPSPAPPPAALRAG